MLRLSVLLLAGCLATVHLRPHADQDRVVLQPGSSGTWAAGQNGSGLHFRHQRQLSQASWDSHSQRPGRQLRQQSGESEPSTPFAGAPPSLYAPSDGQYAVTSSTNTQAPFNAVGRLVILVNSTVEDLCTGALIAPNVVLTAAHCWFDPDSGQTPQSATFQPGWDPLASQRSPYGSAYVTAVKLPSAFTKCSTGGYSMCFATHDVALAFLSSSFTQTIAYGYSSSLPSSETVYTAGYPSDKCQTQSFDSCSMWYTRCSATYSDTAVNGQDTCLSAPGQSGAPIWVSPSTGTAEVIGILTSTPFGSTVEAPDGETETLWTGITPTLYNTLSGWVSSGANSQDSGAAYLSLQTASTGGR